MCSSCKILMLKGLEPRWFRLHVLENPAFNYGFKSVGESLGPGPRPTRSCLFGIM